MICLASDSSAVLLLSSAPVTLSSALRAFVWSVGTMRFEEVLADEVARELAEFWDRGGATRSMLALSSASLSLPVAMYISTESCSRRHKTLKFRDCHTCPAAFHSRCRCNGTWACVRGDLPGPEGPALQRKLWDDAMRGFCSLHYPKNV